MAVYDGMAVMDGDILLGSLEELRQRKPLPANEKGLVCDICPVWQNSIIPYRIEPGNFTPGYEALIRQAAEYVSQNTNLCLVERTNETDYVSLVASDGCWSAVGRIGGAQHLGLNDSSDGIGCGLGAIIHEFTHPAGQFHEQSREDRYQNIYILWQNITPGYEANFYQQISDGMDHGAYDFCSIMHYGPYAFTNNGQPTILRNDCSTNLGGGDQYTQGDPDAINFKYPLACDCGNGGGCMAPVGQVNKVALGHFSRFVSKEMHGNYKLAEATHIAHRKEIDAMLNGNDPAHAKVRDAWAKLRTANAGTFLKAFCQRKKTR